MTNAERTEALFAKTDRATANKILDNIAAHYGISRSDAFLEVTDPEAESLLDYVTGPERLATAAIMKRHGLR